MKYHVLFCLKTMKKYLRMLSAAVMIGALRVNPKSRNVYHVEQTSLCYLPTNANAGILSIHKLTQFISKA